MPYDPGPLKGARKALSAAMRETYADDLDGQAQALVEAHRAVALLHLADPSGEITRRAAQLMAAEAVTVEVAS